MAFYSSLEPGKTVSTTEAETMIDANVFQLNGQSKLYWGFFPKSRLESLLEEPGCAGLRLYNAFRQDIQSKLIVVAVTEEGDEIEQGRDGESGYFVTRLKFADAAENNLEELAIAHIGKDIATQRVLASYKELNLGDDAPKIAFASFFSARAIRTILTAQNCNGICFYVVGMTNSLVPPFSHLAVAARHVETDSRIDRLEDAGMYVMSEKPCPPHCVPDVLGATPGEVVARKYLISWV